MSIPLIQALSPNFNERAYPVDMLVLHYTGMKDGAAALARMQEDKEPRVSAHYMVEEDGRIYSLVPDDKRAWHAGQSSWQGDEDINSRSIGIEIVNGGHDFGLPPFPEAQIVSVTSLCRDLLERWPIPPHRVVGHSDIAPERKADPGERFPWKRLAEAGVGIWPGPVRPEPWMMHGARMGDAGLTVERFQTDLAAIGYRTAISGRFDGSMALVVTAFQRRWRPEQVSGEGDAQTIALAHAVADMTNVARA